MRLLVCLVAVSLLLHAYVIWRLENLPLISATSNLAPKASQQVTYTAAPEGETDENAIASLQMQVAQLSKRLKSMEEGDGESDVDTVKALDLSDQHSETREVLDSLTRTSHSASDEEWFWEKSGEEAASPSFSQIEGLSINSVVCRSDWCRLEIENTESADQGLISDLELHLKINESLGRDTVIRSGEINGNRRVIFVQ